MKNVDNSTPSSMCSLVNESKPPIAIQCIFRNEFRQDPPHVIALRYSSKIYGDRSII